MREIKFRAWDDRRRMMFPVWDIRQDEQFSLRVNEDEYYDATVGLMQFTGLLDKNGREIYEGDVVRTHNGKQLEVRYSDTEGAFMIGFDQLRGYLPYFAEVIGNRFEHPDLLKREGDGE